MTNRRCVLKVGGTSFPALSLALQLEASALGLKGTQSSSGSSRRKLGFLKQGLEFNSQWEDTTLDHSTSLLCVLATYASIAAIILFFKLKPKKQKAVTES
ncbi:up-regulated during skeletal muscle growth protein 5 [Astyanax mexicanus]|uniref:Up-regulated during skeletal muscle growth protein 5 n=1 Tax=Astyanax mexicanus TaxID=7994 RepID=A0A8T2KSL5_ASTMX|nr:up-regulated during skeletal muscle growth protein 5 [Astyanax mexicanus]